jgi:polysaccharide pyruvyl transferase WcaK-like protein
MLIEIRGAEFQNKGAHLMLRAVMTKVGELIPDARFVIRPNKYADFFQIASANALQRLSVTKWAGLLDASTFFLPRKLRQISARYGIVTAADLDAVLDASGFAYGRPWPIENLRATTNDLRIAGWAKKPYIFLPQAFGDISYYPPFIEALDNASAIYVRDSESLELVNRLPSSVARDRAQLSPDFTFGLAGNADAATRWDVNSRTILIVPNSNSLSNLSNNSEWQEMGIRFFQKLIEQVIASDLIPRILNHGGDLDRQLCEKLVAANRLAPVIDEEDPLDLKGIIASSHAVISGRYHACCSALSSGVPCLGLSWSHKYQYLFEDFSFGDMVLMQPSEEKSRAFISKTANERENISRQLIIQKDRLTAMNDEMWAHVVKLLKA